MSITPIFPNGIVPPDVQKRKPENSNPAIRIKPIFQTQSQVPQQDEPTSKEFLSQPNFYSARNVIPKYSIRDYDVPTPEELEAVGEDDVFKKAVDLYDRFGTQGLKAMEYSEGDIEQVQSHRNYKEPYSYKEMILRDTARKVTNVATSWTAGVQDIGVLTEIATSGSPEQKADAIHKIKMQVATSLAWVGGFKALGLGMKTLPWAFKQFGKAMSKGEDITQRAMVKMIRQLPDPSTATSPIAKKVLASLHEYPMKSMWDITFVNPIYEPTKDFLVHKRFLGTKGMGEGKKSIAEIFQPAIERIQGPTQQRLRKWQATKSLVTELGKQTGEIVKTMPPKELLNLVEFYRNPGMKVQSTTVREFQKQLNKGLQASGEGVTYQQKFRDALSKTFQSSRALQNIPAQDLQQIRGLFQGFEKQFKDATPKQIRKMIKENFIENRTLPPAVRSIGEDLYNLSATVPEMVAKTHKRVQSQMIIDNLKTKGIAKAILSPTDNVDDFLPSKIHGMRDLYVPRDIELELRTWEEIPKLSHSFINQWFVAPWKISKTVLRPATHFRNIFSNVILNDIGGLPFYRMDVYDEAIKQMRGQSDEWKKFSKLTGSGGTFTMDDVVRMEEGMKYGANVFHRGMYLFDKMTKVPKHWYSMEEQMFKFAKYLHNTTDKGMQAYDAVTDAMKWTFNYGEVSRMTGRARTYAIPFFTWTSKVIPLVADTAMRHPARVMKWPAFYLGAQEAALGNLEINDREWDRMQRLFPEYVQEGLFFPMPWRDDKGRLGLINMSYMVPGFGDIIEIQNNPVEWFFGNPVAALAGELRSGEKYGGAPIWLDTDSPNTKFMKASQHVWASLVPSWVPGGTDKYYSTLYDKFTRERGNAPEQPTIPQMMMSTVGIKVTPFDEQTARRRKRAIKNIRLSEIGSERKSAMRRAPTYKARDKARQTAREKRRQVIDQYWGR